MAGNHPKYGLFDALAVMNQFRAVEEAEPEFYKRNFHAVRFGTAGVTWWVSHSEEVRLVFSLAAEMDLDDAAEAIRGVLSEHPLTGEAYERALAQLGECLPALYRAAQQPDLPDWLGKAKAVLDWFAG
jgi:hypothetical protein